MDHRHFLHRRSQALKRAGLLIEADDIARENEKREAKGLPPLDGIKPICPPKNALQSLHVSLSFAFDSAVHDAARHARRTKNQHRGTVLAEGSGIEGVTQ